MPDTLHVDERDRAVFRTNAVAVLLTSLVVWEAMRPLPEPPVAFAGHSLGQVTALIAAGALPLDDGVRFAARRAELTQAAADAHPGRMAALLGATLEQAEDACAAAPDALLGRQRQRPGPGRDRRARPTASTPASARAKELGVKRVTPLNVGGAFHTPLMRDATAGLSRGAGDARRFAAPAAPVVSNHDAVAYADADGWRDRLADARLGPGALALDHGHARRPRRRPRSSRSATARCSRRSPSAARPTVTVRNVATPDDIPTTTWRSGNPWKPC